MSRIHSQADQLIPPHLIGLTHVTHEEFEELCVQYPELQLELTSSGELIVMPPTGWETGSRNFYLTGQFATWARNDGSGVGFDSSTAFILPNGAIRAPDISWIKREKLGNVTASPKRGFASICPDFVVELRSHTDRLPTLLNKMEEYMENGALLGWLIDPKRRRVYVYRVGEDMVVLEDPTVVSGDPLLPGFELRMEEIW